MGMRMHRRRFLGQAAAGTVLAANVGHVWGAADEKREPLRLGIIGINGQGNYNLTNVAHENIVALCDVDETRSAPQRKKLPRAEFFVDYRRLIDRKDIQAVVISTPDHHHAFAAVAAMQAGKHVYCEKPLAHSVYEVRLMRELAAKNKLVTQMGTQIHAGDNYRQVVELIQAGAIGPVRRVHVWCERRTDVGRRGAPDAKPPEGLHYDLWLGPAPARPYDESHLHFKWRWWWDFGGGVLADMACHFMDLPHWALELRSPTTVAASGRRVLAGDNAVPDVMQVEYEYPSRGTRPPVHLTWYHGVPGPDLNGKVTYPGYTSGVLFEGENGQLLANYSAHRLLPEDKFRDYKRPTPTIPRSIGHHREWLEAIRTGGPTTCNFDYSGALAESVLLGNVAYRSGEKLQFDAKTAQVTNTSKAAQFLRREYRKGWNL